MFYRLLITFLIVLPISMAQATTVERLVTNASDEVEDGVLRYILQDACDTEEDDIIRYDHTWLSEIHTVLNDPLVIPADCRGKVTLQGSDEVDTLLDGVHLTDGGETPGDSCILHVYSNNHTIKNFSFISNEKGAGICLFGRNNKVEDNRLGQDQAGHQKPNRYGVVVSNVFQETYEDVDGQGNQIYSNKIGPNYQSGLWIQADQITIKNNQIKSNARHGIYMKGDDSLISSNTISSNGGCPTGESFSSDPDNCFSSLKAGSKTGGSGILLDQGSSHIQIGGDSFEEDHNTIQFNRNGGVRITGDNSNTSILITHNIISKNYGFLPDIDLNSDGVTFNDLLDIDEGPNTLINYVDHFQAFPLVPGSDGEERYWSWGIDSDPFNQDSDGDGLFDGAEDANNNGVWDGYLLESSPLLPDSDNDGFIDSTDTCPSIYNPGQEPWYCEV